MNEPTYKKMAGTAAVFIRVDYAKASPVERDGLIWTATELHMDAPPEHTTEKQSMQSVLALEGLEEYDPAQSGDIRRVASLDAHFMYVEGIKGWVQVQGA